jgi:hypothetical protein
MRNFDSCASMAEEKEELLISAAVAPVGVSVLSQQPAV